MAFIQNQVYGLVKTFECSLKKKPQKSTLPLPLKIAFCHQGYRKQSGKIKVLENRCSNQVLLFGLNTKAKNEILKVIANLRIVPMCYCVFMLKDNKLKLYH